MKRIAFAATLLAASQAMAGYYTPGTIWNIDGKVPVLTSDLTTSELAVVNQGIDLFQRLTPIRAVNWTNDGMYYDTVCSSGSSGGCGPMKKYVLIRKGNCSDSNLYEPTAFGLVTITVNESCMAPAYIAGKLGMAVGIRFEHKREDRNSYVQYNYGNVNTPDPGTMRTNQVGSVIVRAIKEYNPIAGAIAQVIYDYGIYEDPLEPARRAFVIGGGTAVGPYDYCSFSHFGPYEFNNTGQMTLRPLNAVNCPIYNDAGAIQYVQVTGQRTGLSVGDVATVEAKYPTVTKNRPIIYLSRTWSRPATNVIRFTVSSVGSHPVAGTVASTNWTLNHTPSCQLVSGGSGAPGCLYGTQSYVREISRSAQQYVFEIVNDRSDAAKVSFTMTDSTGRTLTDTIDVRR